MCALDTDRLMSLCFSNYIASHLLLFNATPNIQVPFGPSPERSNSAVSSASMQCGGSHAAARAPYLQLSSRAYATYVPQLQPGSVSPGD